MPSYRTDPAPVSLGLYDVVGADGNHVGFICHAGLAESAGTHDVRDVAVLDMGPPLRAEGRGGRLHASAVGSAELTDDELRKIKTFVDRHANEHQPLSQLGGSRLRKSAPQMYCICPHSVPLYEDDGRYARMRFSCAGFVFEAYKAARILLLDTKALPVVDMAAITTAYPPARLIERGKVSGESLGLEGNGPWPVLFCGYLFHALGRNANLIRQQPYTPNADDQYFLGDRPPHIQSR